MVVSRFTKEITRCTNLLPELASMIIDYISSVTDLKKLMNEIHDDILFYDRLIRLPRKVWPIKAIRELSYEINGIDEYLIESSIRVKYHYEEYHESHDDSDDDKLTCWDECPCCEDYYDFIDREYFTYKSIVNDKIYGFTCSPGKIKRFDK